MYVNRSFGLFSINKILLVSTPVTTWLELSLGPACFWLVTTSAGYHAFLKKGTIASWMVFSCPIDIDKKYQ
jgi:hypothetical protein